ncbi:MAG: inositol-3-phosphate synthase [Thermoprotei archaeon]|nr:MAG: inositol-3-phosphate synthase [Thermoprotei archaeon]
MAIHVGLIGIGNIASMLVQAIEYYKRTGSTKGLIHHNIDGYKISDIEIVYAIDISKYKVGRDLSEAIFAPPNLVPRLVDLPETGVIVRMGKILDGVASYMMEDFAPLNSNEPSKDLLVKEIRENDLDMLINLLPVGSFYATRFYAKVAAEAGISFINCIPEFIASNDIFKEIFYGKRALLLGDDIKGQLGATIVHRTLASLITWRGASIIESYQLNVGGNSDFKNMTDHSRLYSKHISKTMAVASTQPDPNKILRKIYAGPSGYIPFLGNKKVAYIYILAKAFMEMPVKIDLKLEVDDKAMATAVLVDVIRLAKVLMEKEVYGCPPWASAPYFKYPPLPISSDVAALHKLYEELDRLGISISPRYIEPY